MKKDLISYHDMLTQITFFEIWLQEHNITPKQNRLAELKTFLQQMDDSWRGGSRQIEDLKSKLGIEYMIFGLNEASALVEIIKFLSTYPPHNLPRQTIKDMLGGPFLPKDEISGNETVHPRNRQFEIEVAARLGNKGIRIKKFDDVQFDFENKVFSIQCKRLISAGNIVQNIRKAHEQLRQQFSRGNNHGIIALSIDKLIDSDKNILAVDSVAEAESKLISHMLNFVQEHAESFNGLCGSEVMAVFIVARIVVDLNSGTRLNSYSQLFVVNLCEKNTENHSCMSRLLSKIS